jgi:Tfp pilus assembly protein FimT
MKHKNIRGRFTLSELLIHAAFVAIFATLLVPVFTAVRDKTQTTLSAESVRQIGMAIPIAMHDQGVLSINTPAVWQCASNVGIGFLLGSMVTDMTSGPRPKYETRSHNLLR